MQGVGNAIRIFFVFLFEKLIVSRNETCYGVGLGNDIITCLYTCYIMATMTDYQARVI